MSALLPTLTKLLKRTPRSFPRRIMFVPRPPLWVTMPTGPGSGETPPTHVRWPLGQ